jgi:hypothetical protein
LPTDAILTGYDEAHLVTYLRLLDADADGLWRMLRNLHLPSTHGHYCFAVAL